jgi:hypothetical protein
MSHASGMVKFKDNHKLYFEYDGTTDYCINPLYKTEKEARDKWRTYKNYDKKCICGKSEEVLISTKYGSGNFEEDEWKGKACRHCMVITDGFIGFQDYDRDDQIKWFY